MIKRQHPHPFIFENKEVQYIRSEADLGLLQHPRWSFQPLTIITKRSILDVAAVLGPPLKILDVLPDNSDKL